MTNLTPSVSGAFGLFSMAGGVIGFVKAQSRPSLIAGLISGMLLLGAAALAHAGRAAGPALAAGVSLLLGAKFFMSWRVKRRFMPDLLMLGFSAATLAAAAKDLFLP